MSSACQRNGGGMTNMRTCATEKDGEQRQWILSRAIIPNAALQPPKLDKHFNNKHDGKEAGNDIVALSAERACFNQTDTLSTLDFHQQRKFWYVLQIKLRTKLLNQTNLIQLVGNWSNHNLSKWKPLFSATKQRRNSNKWLPQMVWSIIDSSAWVVRYCNKLWLIRDGPVKLSLQVDESTDVSSYWQL